MLNLSKIDKAHILAILGIIGTGIAAIVPSESGNIQAVVVALGGGVSALYPIVKAIEKLADSNVSAGDVKAGAVQAAREEIGKIDFDALARAAVEAKGLPNVQALVAQELQRVLSGLSAQAPVAPAPPAV